MPYAVIEAVGLGAFVLGGAIGGRAAVATQCYVGQWTGGPTCTEQRLGLFLATGGLFGAYRSVRLAT